MKRLAFNSSVAMGIPWFFMHHLASAKPSTVDMPFEEKLFVPLSCNSNMKTCESWTDRFGERTLFEGGLFIIPCGECVFMDSTLNGATLTFDDGIDIRGKLMIMEGTCVKIVTPMIVVQGELEMYSTQKPVCGAPSIHVLLLGMNEGQTYEPLDENSKRCSADGTPLCEVGKKSITVAGGKITSKCHVRFRLVVYCDA